MPTERDASDSSTGRASGCGPEDSGSTPDHLTDWPEFEPMWEQTRRIDHPYKCECDECMPY